MNTAPALQKLPPNSEVDLEVKIHEFYRGLLINPLQKVPPLPQIASGLNISLSKFQTAFKNLYGCSPYRAYLNIRFEYAKQILCTNQYKVHEISTMLGYCQTAKFVMKFREHTGLTPKQYAKAKSLN